MGILLRNDASLRHLTHATNPCHFVSGLQLDFLAGHLHLHLHGLSASRRPLRIQDHDGKLHLIYLLPGQMLSAARARNLNNDSGKVEKYIRGAVLVCLLVDYYKLFGRITREERRRRDDEEFRQISTTDFHALNDFHARNYSRVGSRSCFVPLSEIFPRDASCSLQDVRSFQAGTRAAVPSERSDQNGRPHTPLAALSSALHRPPRTPSDQNSCSEPKAA